MPPFWTIGCLYGASSVMLGAFGAHGLKKRIADPARIANWGTAAQYQVLSLTYSTAKCSIPVAKLCQLVHSAVLTFASVVAPQNTVAMGLLTAGMTMFSVPLRTGMPHWPGDIPVKITQTSDMNTGAECNLRTLSMSAHTGTHMDAPLHFVANGGSIDRMPIDATVGPARVVFIENDSVITRQELQICRPQKGERLLFKTRNSRWWQNQCRLFMKNFVAIEADAARYLVECRVRTVGVDYLSVGAFKGDGIETHRVLLGAGVWVVEGLDLSAVEPGAYELVCLPLRIEGGDGAPARAALRRV